MCFTNQNLTPKTETILLSALALEIDTIFLQLRKADKIIRQELHCLSGNKIQSLKEISIFPIHDDDINKKIWQVSPDLLGWDEHILYMLEDENNNLFKLIDEYNQYLRFREIFQDKQEYGQLQEVDEKLSIYIRRLGAMLYHLNSHINLLMVLLGSKIIETENKQMLCVATMG